MSEISVAANSSLNIFTAIRLWKPKRKIELQITFTIIHRKQPINLCLKSQRYVTVERVLLIVFVKKWDIPVLHRLKKCWRLKTQLLKPLCSRLILSNMTL